jgi:hypothetical protein
MTRAYDHRRMNDRYDAWKAFWHKDQTVGVGLEIEHWEINNDLLKFRRGQKRGQIAVGVIVHANPAEVAYAYHHVLRMTEPLWACLLILFCSPDGPGLPPYDKPPPGRLTYAPLFGTPMNCASRPRRRLEHPTGCSAPRLSRQRSRPRKGDPECPRR